MNFLASHSRTRWNASLPKIAALAAAIACCAVTRAADKPAEPAKAVAASPKSVFVNDANGGKDPFFPSSTRRKEEIASAAPAPSTNAAPPASALLGFLKLKGIAGTKEQPLALINGTTITTGECAEIKCGLGQIVKIRCREIRVDSVLIELAGGGELRELKLRKGI